MTINSDTLSAGAFFLYDGALYVKTSFYDEVVRIFDGVRINNFMNRRVEPVKVRITVDEK